MGAKAKAAMQAGESAIGAMKTNANDLVQAYMGMVNQKRVTIQWRKDLLAVATKKYPGKQDLSAEYASDPVIKNLFDTIDKSKAQTRGFRQSILTGTVLLKQNIAKAQAAMDDLNILIIAKQGKKDAAKNPLAKVAAAIKTKSLGDLRDQKKAIDKAIGEAHALTVAIVDYAEKKMAKAAGS